MKHLFAFAAALLFSFSLVGCNKKTGEKTGNAQNQQGGGGNQVAAAGGGGGVPGAGEGGEGGEGAPGAEGEGVPGAEGEGVPGAEGEGIPGAEGEGVPGTEGEGVPGAEGNVPGAEVPGSDDNVPAGEGKVPGAGVPGAEGKVPGAGGTVPESDGNVPGAGVPGGEGGRPAGGAARTQVAVYPEGTPEYTVFEFIKGIQAGGADGEVDYKALAKWISPYATGELKSVRLGKPTKVTRTRLAFLLSNAKLLRKPIEHGKDQVVLLQNERGVVVQVRCRKSGDTYLIRSLTTVRGAGGVRGRTNTFRRR